MKNNYQQKAILDALTLYNDTIRSIEGYIACESMMAGNTKQNGKPTKMAIRSNCRILSAQERLSKMKTERDDLANSFGIKL